MGVFVHDLGKQDRPWHPTTAHHMSGIWGLAVAARWAVFHTKISAGMSTQERGSHGMNPRVLLSLCTLSFGSLLSFGFFLAL